MDWKLIITDLTALGFSQVQIATACGCSQATISDLLRGLTNQPNYSLGVAIMGMHKKHCRKKVVA